ncbi:DUF6049 family protein [Aeromicrobium sp.]|uniref:DUF6049 family protein n=1 Tax=Aeromicrobium sp. TaxID=1871063 RepID=UPI003D6A82E1
MLPLLTTLPSPARAADEPDLDVRITGLTPSTLEDRATVTMSGTVTNRDDHAWTDAQAYLVISTTPFTTRKQVDDAIDSGTAYTGERIIDLKSIDDLGDLRPGVSTQFEVRVPYKRLGISGADGVYPVGVQILGTDVDGTRDTTAIGRATTFLPLVAGSSPETASAGLVWPFLMPDRRKPNGDYADPEAFLALVSPNGRLRNQLDLAASTRSDGTTVVIDPALLVGLDDLSRGRNLPKGVSMHAGQRESAQRFLEDLIGLARDNTSWVLEYDRPDILGITQSSSAGALSGVVEQATAAALEQFQLTGRRVAWPTDEGVTAPLLSAVRGTGEKPVIVSPSAVPGWERRDGSIVQYAARSGPMPLLVNDALDTGVPGQTTVATLRQRMLGEAALASLQTGADPGSRADAVAIIDPRWNPGAATAEAQLNDVFGASFVDGVTLEDLMNESLRRYEGSVPRTAKSRPIGDGQIAAAAGAVETSELLGRISPENDGVQAESAQRIAEVLGVRWRELRAEGLATARAVARRLERDLDRITIEGPGAVTLSSSEGSFPVTISNDTDHPVRVSVQIESSNPAFGVPDSEPVDVAAGERHTLTIDVDMRRQTSATLTARMITSDGEAFGVPAVFNVRSSRVGAALWVAIGLAAAFVAIALARRFRGHPKRDDRAPSTPVLEADPDD